jgi:hypothetical protein
VDDGAERSYRPVSAEVVMTTGMLKAWPMAAWAIMLSL